jgi:hypothetical protein
MDRENQGSNVCVGRGVKNRGPTHALDGWPLTATLGLGEAGTAQSNVACDGGVCHDGIPPAFGAKQEARAQKGFSRGPQGCDACVARVVKDDHPGLARSTDCAAQWIYAGANNTYASRSLP